MNYTFETLGQLPSQDSVVSLVTDASSQSRVFLTVLTEGLSANKRKEQLARVRAELDHNIINHEGQNSLKELFSGVNTAQTQAQIKNASSAPSLVQYMLAEAERDIIVLDCQEKAAFWQSLRSMGVDHKTLLALAELEHLKPQHNDKSEVKSAGQAHLLCESLVKGKSNLSEFTDVKDLIDRIKRSKKIKIPSFDTLHHMKVAAANQLADVRDNPSPMTVMGISAERILKVRDSLYGLGRFIGLNKTPLTPDQKRKGERNAKIAVLESDFRSKMVSLLKISSRGGISLEEMQKESSALKEERKKGWAAIEAEYLAGVENNKSSVEEFNVDGLEGLDSVFTINRWGIVDINIREGYHFLRQPECLFEFDTDLNGLVSTVFVLATQNGNKIDMQFFHRVQDSGAVLELKNECGDVSLDPDGKMSRWNIYDPDTGHSLMSGRVSGADYYRQSDPQLSVGYIAHIMDTTARMNDPDYAVLNIMPTGGKARPGKHKFPYFSYEVVEDPLVRTQIRTFSRDTDGSSRASPVFHAVDRHVRTYNRNKPNEYRIIIDEHHRGDPEKGVKAKGTEIGLDAN